MTLAAGAGGGIGGPGSPGSTQVEGTIPSGAADTANPVGMAGVCYPIAPAAATAGQRKTLWVGHVGQLIVGAFSTTTSDAGPDAETAHLLSPGGVSLALAVRNFHFNRTTGQWGRASGTATGTSVVLKPEATGGGLMSKIISAATTNPTSIKAAAASVHGIDVYNSGAAVCFLKLYNKASAPVVGTDIPVKVIAIPPGAPREVNRPLAEAFSVGLAYAITTGYADADTGAVTAGQVTGSIDYA